MPDLPGCRIEPADLPHSRVSKPDHAFTVQPQPTDAGTSVWHLVISYFHGIGIQRTDLVSAIVGNPEGTVWPNLNAVGSRLGTHLDQVAVSRIQTAEHGGTLRGEIQIAVGVKGSRVGVARPGLVFGDQSRLWIQHTNGGIAISRVPDIALRIRNDGVWSRGRWQAVFFHFSGVRIEATGKTRPHAGPPD